MTVLKVFCYVVGTDQNMPTLLVFKSLDEAGFEVPKGSVEPGETLEQAALREIREESGISEVEVVKSLGVAQYLDEVQHFMLLRVTQNVPSSFTHVVTGDGVDQGFRYEFQWLGITPALNDLLVQGCNRFVRALVEELHQVDGV